MTQDVQSVGNSAPPVVRRFSRWNNPKSNLLTVILFSFLAGMYFSNGVGNLAHSRGDYRWVSDFLLVIAWMLVAVVALRRYLKETQRPST